MPFLVVSRSLGADNPDRAPLFHYDLRRPFQHFRGPKRHGTEMLRRRLVELLRSELNADMCGHRKEDWTGAL